MKLTFIFIYIKPTKTRRMERSVRIKDINSMEVSQGKKKEPIWILECSSDTAMAIFISKRPEFLMRSRLKVCWTFSTGNILLEGVFLLIRRL